MTEILEFIPCSECSSRKRMPIVADNNHERVPQFYCLKCEKVRARNYGCARLLDDGPRCKGGRCGCNMTGKLPGPETDAAEGLQAARAATKLAQEALSAAPAHNAKEKSSNANEKPNWEPYVHPLDLLWEKSLAYGFFWGSPAAYGLTWKETAAYLSYLRGQSNELASKEQAFRQRMNIYSKGDQNELKEFERASAEAKKPLADFWKVAHTKENFERESARWGHADASTRHKAALTQLKCRKCQSTVPLSDMVEGLELLEQRIPLAGSGDDKSWRQGILMVKFIKLISPMAQGNQESKWWRVPESIQQDLPEVSAADLIRYGGSRPLSYSQIWAEAKGWIPPAQEIHEDRSGPLPPWYWLNSGEQLKSREVANQLETAARFLDFCRRCVDAYGPQPARGRAEPSARVKLSPRLRFKILQRDNFRCTFCGRSQNDGVTLHVDHIIPVARGGQDDEDNLQTLCEGCNLGKGTEEII